MYNRTVNEFVETILIWMYAFIRISVKKISVDESLFIYLSFIYFIFGFSYYFTARSSNIN